MFTAEAQRGWRMEDGIWFAVIFRLALPSSILDLLSSRRLCVSAVK
jgi:hypothetical protein